MQRLVSIFAGWWEPRARAVDTGLDAALHRTLRGVVAGAAPRADAWERLQGRIHEQAGAKPFRLGGAAPPPAVWGQPWVLGVLAGPRLVQPGLGLLLQ